MYDDDDDDDIDDNDDSHDDDTVQCVVLCFNDSSYNDDTNDGNGDDDAVDTVVDDDVYNNRVIYSDSIVSSSTTMLIFIYYHYISTGLLGDAGQFCIPDGEWFCTYCTSNNDDNHVMTNNDEIDNHDNNNDRDQCLDKKSNQHHSLMMMSKYKSQYHLMRKERNRVLLQWQNEKKIMEKFDKIRKTEIKHKNDSLNKANNQISDLENKLNESNSSNRNLMEIFEILLKELQRNNSHHGHRNNCDKTSNNRWKSINIQDILTMNSKDIEEFINIIHCYDGNDNDDNIQNDTTLTELISAASNIDNTSYSYQEIPKPWLSKTKVSQNDSQNSYMNNDYKTTNSNSRNSYDGKSTAIDDGSKKTDTYHIDRHYTHRNRTSLATIEYGSHTTLTNSINSHIYHSNQNETTSARKSISPTSLRAHQYHHRNNSAYNGNGSTNDDNYSHTSYPNQSINTFNDDHDDADDDHDHDHHLVRGEIRSGNDTNSTGSSGDDRVSVGSNKPIKASKFINPLKNRLQDLLKSVEAETDAFVGNT